MVLQKLKVAIILDQIFIIPDYLSHFYKLLML